MTTRVLVVEDRDATARRLVKTIELEPAFEALGAVHDVAEALAALDAHKPDIVLVDLGLPDGSGLDVIDACRSAPWDCQAIVISIFGDEDRVISAIRMGAQGYLQKGATPDEIHRGIKSVLQGGAPISPQIARHVLQELARSPAPQVPAGEDSTLTDREREVLSAIASGYKRQEVADQLGISIGTVGNHVNNIYKKLNVNSNMTAVVKAGKMGLL